jgi:hypothetical protein
MFDKTSVVMLCMMTFAFLIPCALSYMPGLSFLNTYSYAPASAGGQGAGAPAGQAAQPLLEHEQAAAAAARGYDLAALGHASAPYQPPGLQQRQAATQRSVIPPRPPARVQPVA